MARTRRLEAVLGVVTISLALVGCDAIKKRLGRGADGGADPSAEDASAEEEGDAATKTVTGTGAKNEGDVVRFADEENIEDEEDELERELAVRTRPRSGAIVVTLPKGTKVMKVAKHLTAGVLIEFQDPQGDGLLMGWVPPAAFVASEVPKAKSQLSQLRDAGAKAAGDAGTKSPADAGAKTADAGAKPAADAGAAAAPGPKKTDITWQPDAKGICPAEFVLVMPLCRRVCTSDTSCPRNVKCVSGAGGGKKYCSTDVK